MAEEFKVLIGTELDTASIDSLKQQISGIKTNPVKIKIDTSDVTSQINKIKNQIQNLSGIKINLTGGNVGGEAVKNVSEATKVYNDLMRIQKQLNSTRIKINGLDATKDTKQIGILSGQLQRLQADYNNLYHTFNKHFSTDQLDNLNRAFEVTSNQISATNAKMSDTSAIKQQETAFKELLNISQQISKTELKIGGLKGIGGHSNEVAELESQLNNLRNTYQQLATSMQGNLSTDQLRTLSQQTYDTADKLNVLNARIQDTKQKLANTSLNNFANDAGKINKITEQFVNLKTKTVEVESAMTKFKQSVLNMNVAKQSGDVDKIVQSYNEYENAIKRVSAELKRASSVDSLNHARTNLSSQMDVWLNNNSAAAARFGIQIKALQKELASCDATRLNGIKTEFTEITRQAQIAGVATQSFGDKFKDQLSKLSTYFSASMLIMTSIRGLKEMYQNVMDIDTAFTELKKVTDETDASYNKFLSNAASNAKEIGTTIDNYITSSADFARLGYTFNQSQELAKVANIYNVVGDDITDVNEATQSIISTMKAFGIEADNSISIVDKFNEVGNDFAISSGGIGEAMTRSASSMAAANNTIDETIALITAANTVVQDAPRVGNAFKTISMRIRGAKTELKEAGLDADGMAESTAKLREEIKALSGVDIMINDDTFKSTYQIMDELSAKWQNLTDIQQASITELIAGKHQGNVMSSLMNNFNIARQALDVSLNSEGSAMKEHKKWMESLEARVQKLAATFQSLSQTFLSSDFLKGLVDGLTSIINIIDVVLDKFDVMPVLISAISMALSFKGIGFVKLNADADGFLNRLTLMNTSLGNIRRSIAIMFSNLSNSFKTSGLKGGFSTIGGGIKNSAENMLTNMLVPQKDLAAIKAYNTEFDRLSEKVNQSGVSVSRYTIAQKAANNTMKDASTSAQAIVKGVNGGKVAVEGLGASMLVAKAKTIALQVATTALNMAISMGLSVAISSIISAITSWINKEEEARKKTAEIGEVARKEAKDIISLYNIYHQADLAYKNNIGSKEDLQSATNSLREALNLEQSELEELINKYGDVDKAIQQVTNDTLKSKLSYLKNGYLVEKNNLNGTVKRNIFQSIFNPFYTDPNIIDVDLTKDIDAAKVLKKSGFINDNEINPFFRIQFDVSSTENVITMYESLINMKEALEKETGTGKQWLSIDELGEKSDVYNKIVEKINTMGEKYEAVNNYINDINKTAAQIEYNNFISKNGIPKTVNDFSLLRNSLIQTAKSSGDFTGSQEQIENSIINLLSEIPELSNLIDEYNAYLEQTEESSKGIEYITNTIDTLIKKSKSATSSISKLNEVLNAQTTGFSISLEDFNSEELADYQSALEYVNGSMQINAEKSREIARAKVEEQTATNNTNKELRQAQYIQNINQIKEYKRQLKDKNNLTDDEISKINEQISVCKTQNEGYLEECNQLDVLNASLRESISAYNEWKAAQNVSESGDMFDDTLTAIKTINDTLNDTESDIYGRVGRKDFEASVGLIIPDSVNSEDEQAINNYLDSIRNLFTFNKEGDINGLNIEEFCQEAVDKGLMVLDEASDSYQVAGGKTMYDFAKGMNLSMPLVQAMFGELEEFGGEFDWEDEMFSTFGDRIVATQKEISDLETEIEDLNNQKNAGIDIDSSQIDEAKLKLEELKKKEEELTEKALINIETNIELDHKLSDAESELEGWQAKLESGDFNGTSKVEIEANIESAKTEISKIQKEKDKLQEPTQVEIQASLGNIDTKIARLQKKIDKFSNKKYYAKFGLSDEDAQKKVNSFQSEINKLTNKQVEIKTYAETKKSNIELTKLDDKEINDKDFIIEANTTQAENAIDRVNNKLDSLPNKKVINISINEKKQSVTGAAVSIIGGHKINGTAYVSGTAKASGDWGNKEAGKTLVGELGREIVVNPHTGKWYTVGDNGAEFVNIPKNAIVFNHLQTKDLLSKGFVASRALALTSRTALASGTVSGDSMVTGGIKRKYVTSVSKNQELYSTSGVNINNSNVTLNNTPHTNNSTNSNSVNEKEKTALEKFQEWINMLFDWVEIKIQKQSEKIDTYIDKAENAKDAGKYTSSAKNYRKAINATTKQISNEQKAAKKYQNQANSIVNKAVSMGIVSQQQANSIKTQVKNGKISIKSYSKEIQEVIKGYQEWYKKSKDASSIITELHNKIRTYIQDLKDMRDAKRDEKLEKIDIYTSIGTNSYTSTTNAQNSQLNYRNSQLNKKDKAYNTEVAEVNKDVKKIGKSGTYAINKALRLKDVKGKSKKSKAYKKALNNAKKSIKAKKAVSSADLKIIKSHSISVHNKLYAYNLSLDNLEIAKLEQATNVAATSAERLENTAKKYENKDIKTNDKISLLKLKSDNATSAKSKNKKLDKVASQYDKIVENDKAEIKDYQKIQKSSSKTIKNKAGTGSKFKNLIKKDKKNVKSYIKMAKNAAKSGKNIDASVISKLAEFYSKGYVSKAFYEACINYNNAIEHREEAEAQLKIDEQTAIQEKATIGTEKFNNVEQKYTNKQNTTKSSKNKESINQSIKSTKGHLLSVSDYQTMLNYSKQEQQIYSDEIVSLNKTIQENLDSGYWTTDSQEYIDAMNRVSDYEQEVLNCQQEQEELNNEIAQLPYTIFDKAIGLIQSIKSNFQSLLSIKTTRGVSKTNSDILTEISNVNTELAKQMEKRDKLWEDYQTAVNSGGAYGGKNSEEWLTEFYDADTEVNNLKADVESLNNEIAQLPYETYEKSLELLDSIASYNKSITDLTKAQGRDLSESDYLRQISDNNAKIQKYESERIQAYSDYMKALASHDGAYGGMTSDEWLGRYNDLGTTINGLKVDNEDIRDALRDDVYWRTFERSHKAAQALKDILSGIADLIDDDMLYDKNGNFTEYGVVQMANIVKQFETARKEVQNYTNDIQNLNKLYEEGFYNQDEFNEKLNELQNGLFDSASAMKSYISEIIDMNKKLAQSELDALFKLIDTRNDALIAKKNYYDYDNTIKDKTKDIQALEAQKAALEGIETAEAKAQRARLEADLADKKNDLNDTIMNHSFDLSKDALDELKTILQDEFDERWDNIGQDLNEIQKLIAAANELTAAQSHIVRSALNKLLLFYGINPTATDLNEFGNVTGYASGIRKVDRDKVAWTQENGQEVIVRKSDGAILTPLSRGDSVIPNDLTNNLFDWGMYNPQEFADSLVRGIPDVPKAQSPVTTVEQHYDSLLNVEGNVDSTVVTDLEKFAKTFYQGAYRYTVNEIARDARKKGIKT